MQLKYKTGRTKITQTHFSFVFSRQWMVFFCCSVRCNVSCACRPLWLRYKNAYKLIKLHFLVLIILSLSHSLWSRCGSPVYVLCIFCVCTTPNKWSNKNTCILLWLIIIVHHKSEFVVRALEIRKPFWLQCRGRKKHSNREKCCPLLFGPLFRAFTIPVEIESEMRCNQFRMCVYVNVTQWKLQHNDRIKFSVCLLTTTSSRPLFWRCLFSSRTWKGTILVTLFWTLTHNSQN